MRPRDTIHRRCASSPADDLANAMGEPMRPGFARVAARVAALQLFCRRSACCQTAVARPFRRFVARPRARSPRPVAPPPSLCAQRRALTGGAAPGARRLGARRVRSSGGVTSALSSVAAGAPRAPCPRARPETRRRGRANARFVPRLPARSPRGARQRTQGGPRVGGGVRSYSAQQTRKHRLLTWVRDRSGSEHFTTCPPWRHGQARLPAVRDRFVGKEKKFAGKAHSAIHRYNSRWL